ncbi:hypothetical protein BJV77DRAFT_1151034 [Russula vinacea]|nr:hypothetical protein BJV77DRAFT_1151034 [Russula vinacea]
MALATLLLCASSLALLSYGQQETWENHDFSDPLSTCNQIAAAISSVSQVFFLLRILGSTRTPFAVKGGGHALNPGFSSTKGVQIAMTRFNETRINSTNRTVDVGAGLIWDQVYETLEPTGLNLVGGRIPNVGVSGLTLGGGYSFLSNQYGLTVDNVARFELVLPNGTVTNVTSEDDDLWFGLRGGLNNFGIVTKFIFKLYPQSNIWGGIRLYSNNQLDEIKEALFKFQQKNDTKAEVGVSLSYSSGQFLCAVIFFMTRPLLREYMMISWTSPLSRGMSRQNHFSTIFEVWVLRARLTTIVLDNLAITFTDNVQYHMIAFTKRSQSIHNKRLVLIEALPFQ